MNIIKATWRVLRRKYFLQVLVPLFVAAHMIVFLRLRVGTDWFSTVMAVVVSFMAAALSACLLFVAALIVAHILDVIGEVKKEMRHP